MQFCGFDKKIKLLLVTFDEDKAGKIIRKKIKFVFSIQRVKFLFDLILGQIFFTSKKKELSLFLTLAGIVTQARQTRVMLSKMKNVNLNLCKNG